MTKKQKVQEVVDALLEQEKPSVVALPLLELAGIILSFGALAAIGLFFVNYFYMIEELLHTGMHTGISTIQLAKTLGSIFLSSAVVLLLAAVTKKILNLKRREQNYIKY